MKETMKLTRIILFFKSLSWILTMIFHWHKISGL